MADYIRTKMPKKFCILLTPQRNLSGCKLVCILLTMSIVCHLFICAVPACNLGMEVIEFKHGAQFELMTVTRDAFLTYDHCYYS